MVCGFCRKGLLNITVIIRRPGRGGVEGPGGCFRGRGCQFSINFWVFSTLRRGLPRGCGTRRTGGGVKNSGDFSPPSPKPRVQPPAKTAPATLRPCDMGRSGRRMGCREPPRGLNRILEAAGEANAPANAPATTWLLTAWSSSRGEWV